MQDPFEAIVARTLREQAAESRLTPRPLEQVRQQARRLSASTHEP